MLYLQGCCRDACFGTKPPMAVAFWIRDTASSSRFLKMSKAAHLRMNSRRFMRIAITQGLRVDYSRSRLAFETQTAHSSTLDQRIK